MGQSRFTALAAVFLCATLLAGCEGDTGDPGAQGPAGPPGTPGDPGTPSTGSGVPISTVDAKTERLDAQITSVEVPDGGGAPVVNFSLKNALNQGISGLTPASIRFTLGQLQPGTGGGSSQWRSYIIRQDAGQTQGNAEVATAGTLEEVSAGTYRYTFASALSAYTGATYDAALRHRVGFEVRETAPVNNATHDFSPNGSTLATSREIVDNDTCNACHDVLEFHGGARFDTQYCVACHNPQSLDGQAPNASVDMKVMIHKIHGQTADTVTVPYQVTGFGNTVYDFSEVEYPQDPRNCQTCHEENDTNTPEASSWRTVANRESCGSCHDALMSTPLNPAAGTMTHPGGIVFSDDTQCLQCHSPDSTVTDTDGNSVAVAAAHAIPIDIASAKFAYEVVSVTDTGGGTLESGDTPRVTIRVADPTNSDAPYDIQAAGPFLRASASLNVDLAWTGWEFSNMGPIGTNTDSSTPFQPLRVAFASGATPVVGVTNNADGTFSADAPGPLPTKSALFAAGASAALETGGLVAILEGRPREDADGDGVFDSLRVAGAGGAFAWDGDATARLNRVEITRCNQCHEVLSLHGGNRTDNTELCATCHNPNATDIRQRPAGACSTAETTNANPMQAFMRGTTADVSIDFKYMIHAIHAGATAEYVVCGNGNSVHDYRHVVYPGKLNNCEGCHVPPTTANPSYYGRDPATMLSVSVDAASVVAADAGRLTITDDLATTPMSASCSGCHTNSTALAHMTQNGGVFAGIKLDTGAVTNSAETCALCHGPGRSADVRKVHGVEQFQYNASE